MMSTTLWRPVGVYELRLIAQSGFRAFPPRLPEQPIFYPVCNQEYAAEIASKWNTGDPNSGHGGFVTRFEVADEIAAQCPRHIVGGCRRSSETADFHSARHGERSCTERSRRILGLRPMGPWEGRVSGRAA